MEPAFLTSKQFEHVKGLRCAINVFEHRQFICSGKVGVHFSKVIH